MALTAELGLQRGELPLDVALRVEAGETVALLGPNGAGKTSALHAIAGLLRIGRGSIRLDDRVLDGGPGGPFVPSEARDIGVVFQDRLLFPRLAVLDNVAYGLRCRGRSRRAARTGAAGWLERVGIGTELHGALPAALSGGQAQRVAVARALASAPRLLLLDEPLAAVDASARLVLQRELQAHLATFVGPRIVVVHDLADALAFADRIVVIERGRIVQHGAIRDLANQPHSRYVADLVGLNCFAGTCRGNVVTIDRAQLTVAAQLDGDVLVTVHPRAVSLFRERPDGSPRNVWQAPVTAIEPTLDRVRVQLGGALPMVAEVTPAAIAALGLAHGSSIWVAVKATEIAVAPR